MSAPAESLYGLARPSRRRWEPLRAGITGLFHYDEQVFTFHRGRLLLRGDNGSGKSMALEVLLPYVLDADLSPERLSTFGIRERGMYLWLLGHDENEDRTNARGYVWVEFGRMTGDGEEYFTVGAGLHAVRASKRVTAWYFTTAGRVGHELDLGAAGTEPKNQNQLAAALADLSTAGVMGRVHPAPDAHRKEVNRVLYGLDDRQFEALRKTLVHLRKPKLSDKLSETKLDEVLRESLPPVNQTVTDELADGFERLDRHRLVIDELTAAHAALAEISIAYTDFLDVLVGRRAAEVADAVRQTDTTKTLAATATEESAKADEALRLARDRADGLRTEVRSLGAEIETIKELDLYKEGAQLVPLREKATALITSAKASRDQADELRDAATQSRNVATAAGEAVEAAAVIRDERAANTDSIASRLPQNTLPVLAAGLVSRLEMSFVDGDAALAELRAAVRVRIEEIDQLRDLVGRSHRAIQRYRVAHEATGKAKQRVADAEKDAEDARTSRSQELASYLEAVTAWIAQSTQLVLGAAPPQTWPPDFPERAVRAWGDNAAQARRAVLAAEARALETIPPMVTPLVRQASGLSDRCAALGPSLSDVWTTAGRARDARIGYAAQVGTWSAGLVELPRAGEVPEFVRVPAPRTLTRAGVTEWATTAATSRLRAVEREATTISAELESVQETLKGKQTEHGRLQSGGLPRLPVPHTRLGGRDERLGSPLFLLVDFVPGLEQSKDERALLEASLLGAGLADAWVFPDGTIAADPDGGPLLDLQLTTTRPAATSPLSTALCPDPALPPDGPVSAEVVRSVLTRVGLANTAREGVDGLTVAWDGTWAAGPLHGAYRKNQVDLIGAGSREAMRQRRMAELAAEIDELEAICSSLRERLQLTQDTAVRAEQERASVPADDFVQAAESTQSKTIGDASVLVRRVVEEAGALAAAGHQVMTSALTTLGSLGLTHQPPESVVTLGELEGNVLTSITAMLDQVWTDHPTEPDIAAVLVPAQRIATTSAEWQSTADRAIDALASVVLRSKDLDRQFNQRPSETALVTATTEVDVRTRIAQDRLIELKALQEAENTAADERDEATAAAEAALDVAGLSSHRDRLDELRGDTEQVRSAAEDWINAAAQQVRLTHTASTANTDAGKSEEIARRATKRAATAELEADLAQRKYDHLNAQMGAPHQELMHKLGTLETRRTDQTKVLEDTAARENELGRTAERKKLGAADARAKVDQAAVAMNVVTEALADVHRLGLLRLPDATELPPRFGPEPLRADQLEAVRGWAGSLVPRARRSAEQQDKAQTRAVQVRGKKEQDLAGHVVLRERVDRSVFTLTASRNGHERPVHDTLGVLAHDLTQTEQLLEKEETELFEKFLSDEVRLEVGQRVMAALALVDRMNSLMGTHPTSSGYVFRLRWQATAESEVPPDLIELLKKPEGLLYRSERDRLSSFYRKRITTTRSMTTSKSWREQLSAMLDYRQWHRFDLLVKHRDSAWVRLDRRRHNAMSGGEKAVALHLPLFAAAATHCEASRILVHEDGRATPGCPRLILLDEIFAGVDAKNRDALFDLITRLDLDLVATSESELGTYPSLDGISVYNLIVDDALPGVLAARSVWDGRASHDMLDYDLNEDQ